MRALYSAKDFRTRAGTLIAACALARMNSEVIEGRTERRKLIVAAVKETAAQLGNTPAVCKSSYIWPPVLTGFTRGSVLHTSRGPRGAERALLRLLRNGGLASPPPLRIPGKYLGVQRFP